ncbi:proline dehydrogenase family protein [Pontibacter sp. G13]|uniref:proline dehydrogenase family protein n=1 Tax=Pontibacter sp. G13 TaxID=3074898 RepID=UPI002889EB50|nr:proline dehydrogenase family protein [Pontibacter sp. G13]WNJ20193.1 proline dehydrogenase family protein [Pontibacter sp. G13]
MMNELTPTINFEDTALAFRAKSDAQLRRAYWLFRMINSPFLAKVGPKFLNTAFRLKLPVEGLVRKTMFEVFCGGESLDETIQTSGYLSEFGVKTILDYSVEGEKTEAGFDQTCQEIVQAIQFAQRHDSVVFAACKLTGLGSFPLLEKIQRGEALTYEEKQAYSRVRKRVETICQAAADCDVPIFIDAEETWIQEPIDSLAEEMMAVFNVEKPVVIHTVQLYRHDRLEYLSRLIERSRDENFILAVKLVRGAYLEKEAQRAEDMGYENPMQPDKATSDRHYNAALKVCIENHEHVAIYAGTHNEASSLYLTQLIDEHQIPHDHPWIWFMQLLGMSDHISFNLSHAKFNTAKYLPYGPVRSVMPYLMRRAEENSSIAGQSSRELDLLEREMKRRGLL